MDSNVLDIEGGGANDGKSVFDNWSGKLLDWLSNEKNNNEN